MASADPADTLPRAVLRAARLHLSLVLAVALALAGVLTAYAVVKSPRYTSGASVLVRPLPGNALSSDSIASSQQITVAMETEAGLVSSPAVTAIAARAMHRPVGAVAAPASATVPPNTEIVQIRYVARSAATAQAGAAAYADAFLRYRASQARLTQRYQLNRLQSQVDEAAARLKAASRAASSAHPPPDAASQVQLYANLLASLQASVGQLEVQGFNPGAVVAPASKPLRSGMSLWLLVAGGLGVGLALGVTAAYWRERRQDRVRAASVGSVGGVPLLATIPPGSRRQPLLDQLEPADPLATLYRGARALLLAATRRPTVLCVSAVSYDEPAAEVVANLGMSLSSAGYRVTVVDAAVGSEALSGRLQVASTAGLSDTLLSERYDDVPSHRIRGLVAVSAGTAAASAGEHLSGTGLAAVLSTLREEADYVLVAAPAAPTPEGNAVAVATDGLVLVVADGKTTHAEVEEIVARAGRLGVPVVGAVALPAAQQLASGVVEAASGRRPAASLHSRGSEPRSPMAGSVRLSGVGERSRDAG